MVNQIRTNLENRDDEESGKTSENCTKNQWIHNEFNEEKKKNAREIQEQTRENAAEKVVMDRNKLSSKRALDTILWN